MFPFMIYPCIIFVFRIHTLKEFPLHIIQSFNVCAVTCSLFAIQSFCFLRGCLTCRTACSGETIKCVCINSVVEMSFFFFFPLS